MKATDKNLLTKATLKERGWTEKLIRQFLPEPDQRRKNPHYRSGPPMLLYDVQRIETIEATPEFAEARDRADKRREAASGAVKTKRAEVTAYVERVKIAVPQLDNEKLIERACQSYNDMQEMRSAEGLPTSEQEATPASDDGFLQRITVNYLRHQLTSYERNLERVAGRVGAQVAIMQIREKVYSAIAEQYPWLAKECQRQLKEAEERS